MDGDERHGLERAKVTSFEVGGLDCKNQSTGSAEVSVTWTAEATTAVETKSETITAG